MHFAKVCKYVLNHHLIVQSVVINATDTSLQPVRGHREVRLEQAKHSQGSFARHLHLSITYQGTTIARYR